MTNHDVWLSGDKYESYVGRWSRLVAVEFLQWLSLPQKTNWLDVGCGTGILSRVILNEAIPARVNGVDRSEEFLLFARENIHDARVEFGAGDAQDLPVKDGEFAVAISGLVLNFVPRPEMMIAEMRRAVPSGGTVALYVWDYAGKMQMMRHFFNAAAALDPAAYELDEGRRFTICNPKSLTGLFRQSGLTQVEVRPIDIHTDFKDFDDFWLPFLGGQGPAPSYVMSLSEEKRSRLRERLRDSVPFAIDGSIPLVARAWAVKGVK